MNVLPLLVFAVGLIFMLLAAFRVVATARFNLEWGGLAVALAGLAWMVGWLTGTPAILIIIGLLLVAFGAFRVAQGVTVSLEWLGLALALVGIAWALNAVPGL